MIRRTLAIALAATVLAPAPAGAQSAMYQSTVAIRDALDRAGQDLALAQGPGWTYADRTNVSGDWRRFRARLTLAGTQDADACDRRGRCHRIPGGLPWEWEIDALAVRCSPGVYAVSTPLDDETCPTPLPAWTRP